MHGSLVTRVTTICVGVDRGSYELDLRTLAGTGCYAAIGAHTRPPPWAARTHQQLRDFLL